VKIKRILAGILFLAVYASLSAEAYPPEGWTTNLLEALQESEKTGKDVLLDFTGSDWCIWCHKLRDEVFDTQEFKEYAEENLILVFLDFPNDISQSEDIVKQNQTMAALFGVQGFPTIWLLDSEQVPVLQTGYQEGGSGAFIQTLEQNRIVLEEAKRQEFQSIVHEGIKRNIGSW
jgi:thioredoxin-related protein